MRETSKRQKIFFYAQHLPESNNNPI